MTTPLLAKSGNPVEEAMTLLGHTRAVLSAADAIFGNRERPTRLAQSWLRFFSLPPELFGRFRHHLRVSIAGHDFGKANDGMQSALNGKGEQVVYHEHVSGLLIAQPTILDFLNQFGLDATVLVAAIVSHHLRWSKTARDEWPLASRTNFRVLSEHPDFGALWRLIQEEIGGSLACPVQFPRRVLRDQYVSEVERVRRLLMQGYNALSRQPDRISFLRAVRTALIVCDALGSASQRLPGELEDWARAAFADELTGEVVWREVVKKRIADLRNRNPSRWDDSRGVRVRDESGFTEFQRDVSGGGDRVLLTAPCGSGKTLAAWNWITTQLERRPAARVLFLYPTRATATEGFRDYVSWAPESDAGLFTGTAAFDLEGMFVSPDDPKFARRFGVSPRLYALGHWTKRVVSATVNQFLPFLQYEYSAVCRLPMIAESVIVIDEVHSFDKSMFATLKRFLRDFPSIPVLCMTATLGAERRADLVQGCGLVALPDPLPADLQEASGRPRYEIKWVTPGEGETVARQEALSGKRVLWVSNRVDECLDTFDRLGGHGGELRGRGVPAHCYHSRFKAEDRRQRHNDLVLGFQRAAGNPEGRPIFAATTQVCEMSLDIDAQVLITSLAPIAALIQRMGRCNRHSDPRPGRVLILRPVAGKQKPYEPGELEAAEQFADALHGRTVSQDDLAREYETFDPRVVEPDKLCPFLDSGPFAQGHVESFRDIDDYAVSCVLDDDVRAVLDALEARKPIDAYVVPVPFYLTLPRGPGESKLPRWLHVAPASRYTRDCGFDGRERALVEGVAHR